MHDAACWQGMTRSVVTLQPEVGNPVTVSLHESNVQNLAFDLMCRFVRPGDKVLLVSCSYEHSNPGGDVFKEYEEITAALKVGLVVQTWNLGGCDACLPHGTSAPVYLQRQLCHTFRPCDVPRAQRHLVVYHTVYHHHVYDSISQ